MSYVSILAADKPLPLCMIDLPCTFAERGGLRNVSISPCFEVQKHTYYKWAVDELGLTMKPHQYALDLYAAPESLRELRKYISENFSPGETFELWAVWLGDDTELLARDIRFQELDLDILSLLEKNATGQTCFRVTM